MLSGLGPTVHVLEVETDDPDLVYTFDPLLVTDRGAIPLRPGKPNRAGEPAILEAWTESFGIPIAGRIEPPGTIEGGDTFWLRPDLFCIGRTLRTNASGVAQLADIVGGDVRVFDVPYWKGPAELIHLMSVISPVADDLAVVYLPLLPVGLWELLLDLEIRLVEVPDEEFPTLGCNVLAVRPGVVILAEGNPRTAAALAAAGLRGPHLSRDPDRDQRLGWADLHDPADPSWLTPCRAPSPAPIDRDGLIADLQALIRIPSVTGSEEAVAAWAADGLRDLGLAVEVVTPDPAVIRADPDWPGEEMARSALPVVIGRAGRAGGRRLILSGHLDVVPPGDPATWTTDPWGAEIRDGRMYGRGACDMKGGVAAILAAVRALRTAGDRSIVLDGELMVVLVPSEEDGGQGTLAAIRAGATGDLAIITGAVQPRCRRRPRRRHHVPAHRSGPRGARVAASRGRLRARQAVRPDPGARGRRGAPERGRDGSA